MKTRRLRRWFRLLLRALILLALLAGLGWLLLPQPALLPPDLTWSRRVMDRQGGLLHITLAKDDRYRLWTPLRELPPDLIAATLAHEDKRFHSHAGIDLRSTVRAIRGLVTGRPSGGGSTVTMQLARLRFGLETRSLSGKARQMFRALQLERHYSKDQLLEAYLNLVPCGGNVEGSGTAAWVWLGKAPASLSFRECVALSLIPQRPARRNPARPGPPDPAGTALQRRLTAVLRGREPGPLTEPEASYHLTATVRPAREAPHFTRFLLRQDDASAVVSSLDPVCQDALRHGIRAFLSHAGQEGVRNACAVLVHAPTREVRAWVGSADFYDAGIRGQVDGITSRRPPGSLLKPFIYGLALQQGLIHPQSLVMDAPASFHGYNPENFDRGFAGPLPADQALYRSRNLPAVRLLQQLRPPGFYGFLTQSGVRLPYSPGHYGLALALGSQEITPLEAAGLYAMLADDGRFRPVRLTPAPSMAPASDPPPAALAAGPRFLVREMLRPRVPAPADETWTAGFGGVSWKSGTSHGWRDAWAAGISGDYVLVVWAGDFQGRPNPAFNGRRTAGPLLFSLLGVLPLPAQAAPDTPPPDVKQVSLCAVSGDLPNPCCPQHRQGWYLPGVSPAATCRVHEEVLTDPATGLRVRPGDTRPGLIRQTAEIWPPPLEELFRRAGTPRRVIPPWENGNGGSGGSASRPPVIDSPQAARTYTLRTGAASRRTIPLQAQAAAGVQRLFWFAGQEFLGSAPPGDPLPWSPPAGSSLIRVVDDQGRSASRGIMVELIP